MDSISSVWTEERLGRQGKRLGMFKVFLVEDEVGLRTSIPWKQCGFTYMGGASDGEMACR